jgi:POT family proton-dependent oligopeptide transporter
VVLAATEFWDRISFHGMQALLTLYMAEQLLLPGHIEHVAGFAAYRSAIESVTGPLSIRALATQTFGLYVGFIYLSPVIGGVLGDRVLGRRHAVSLGAILMAGGHFCMAFERSFLVALGLLIAGAGCLRGNLSSQVGDLYAADDRRRADGFQIYVAMVNMGFFLAPIITGALAQHYGWHYGFGFAGIGMLIGLVLYLSGQRDVPADRSGPARRRPPGLDADERRVVTVLCLMVPLLTLFWIAQSQIWNTYNLWVRDHLDLSIGGWMMPVPWMQAIDGLFAVALVPPLLLFWRWQARRAREPDDLGKLTLGCAIFALAMLWLAAAGLVAGPGARVPLVWAIGFHFLEGVGYLYVSPIAIALFSRTAPAAVNATMVSVYYLSIFAGSTISGRLGGLYEKLPATQFWILHAVVVGAASLLIGATAGRIRQALQRAAVTIQPEISGSTSLARLRSDSCQPR